MDLKPDLFKGIVLGGWLLACPGGLEKELSVLIYVGPGTFTKGQRQDGSGPAVHYLWQSHSELLPCRYEACCLSSRNLKIPLTLFWKKLQFFYTSHVSCDNRTLSIKRKDVSLPSPRQSEGLNYLHPLPWPQAGISALPPCTVAMSDSPVPVQVIN